MHVSTSSAAQGSTWPSALSKRGLDVGLADQTRMAGNLSEQNSYPVKFQRLEDETGATQKVSNFAVNAASLQKLGTSAVVRSQLTPDVVHSEKPTLQVLLSPKYLANQDMYIQLFFYPCLVVCFISPFKCLFEMW